MGWSGHSYFLVPSTVILLVVSFGPRGSMYPSNPFIAAHRCTILCYFQNTPPPFLCAFFFSFALEASIPPLISIPSLLFCFLIEIVLSWFLGRPWICSGAQAALNFWSCLSLQSSWDHRPTLTGLSHWENLETSWALFLLSHSICSMHLRFFSLLWSCLREFSGVPPMHLNRA